MGDKVRRYFYSVMSDKRKGAVANIIRLLLSLLSLIFYFIVKFVLFLYKVRILKSYRPQCKVISVGNITLGGTGKTPMVLAIARRLKDSGKKLAILIRGYKGDAKRATSDEVELLKKHLPDVPVLVGRDRIRTAKEAINSYEADIILLDDGFQHWRLGRDIDILTLDVRNPFGNEKLIPRGLLREPIFSLKRADICVLTKVGCDGDSIAKAQGLKNRLSTINKDAAVFNSSYIPNALYDISDGKPISMSEIDGKNIALICAIGDPESFEDSVKSLGARVTLRYYFLDHHKYTEAELSAVLDECRKKDIDTIVTTEKDVPRLAQSVKRKAQNGVRFLALGVELKIDNEERFFGRLYSIFSR